MPTYRVYQTSLSDTQMNELNGPNGGWSSKPEFTAYADLTFGRSETNDEDGMVVAAANHDLFYHVADIEAEDLEDVFRISNMCQTSHQITRYSNRMTTLSVGHVVVNISHPNGGASMCASFGWKMLTEATQKILQEKALVSVTGN